MKKYFPMIKSIVLYTVLTGATVLMSFPLFWMISSSLKTVEETNSPGVVWIPQNPTLEAYTAIFQNQDFLRSYFNSVFYVTLALAGTLISIAAVAYAFSRVDWPGRNVVFFLMLSTMMIPAQALIVPQYVFFNKLDWIGTFNPLLPKDSKERLVIDIERAKEWLAKGAQTTDRMEKILVAEGLMEAKTDFASKVKKAVKNPGKQNRAEDRAKAAEEAKAAAEAEAKAAAEAPAIEEAAPAAEEAPAAEAPAEETPAAE